MAIRALLIEDNPGDARLIRETLRDSASLQAKVGELRQANDSLRRAVELADALRAEDPDRPGWRRTHAAALLDLASVEYTRGMVPDSRKTAERAAELFRGLAELPPGKGHPYDPLLLAAALNRVAVAERESGQLDAALSHHAEAAKLLDALAKNRPAGVNPGDVLHFRARIRLEQCRTWAKTPERRANAEKNLGAVITQWEGLAKDYPKVPAYRQSLAYAHLVRGEFLADANRPKEAQADFEKARQQFEELVKEFPQVPSDRGDLGRAFAGLGRLARAAGDKATAADWLGKAADALRQALEQSPDNAEDRRSLDAVRADQAK